MALPPNLLQAVSSADKGKLSLIAGAGCSVEKPTEIPLSTQCARECHDELVSNGYISAGDCADPTNLSCVADTLYEKHGSQSPLVDLLLSKYALKAACPNEGHKVAAALLAEGVIQSLITLNFDLAFSIAVAELGLGREVGLIDGPHEFANQKTRNVYYLHRNANVADHSMWILRTSALSIDWKGSWEQLITSRVFATPVVLFAGLGSPADVLLESVRLLRTAVPGEFQIYQVDPTDFEQSHFARVLTIPRENYIKFRWCDFMDELSKRVVCSQVDSIGATAANVAKRLELFNEDLTFICEHLKNTFTLLELGALRSYWFLDSKSYRCENPQERDYIADLILVVARVSREKSVQVLIKDDGVVEFARGDKVIAAYFLASGRGIDTRTTIEAHSSTFKRRFRNRSVPVSGVLMSATSDGAGTITTAPNDIVADIDSHDILFGREQMTFIHAESIRAGNVGQGLIP